MSDEIMTLKSSELRKGDIVLEYGMHVRLDTALRTYTEDVFAWDGTVVNLAEVLADGFVPPSFLREWRNGQLFRTNRWVVQGNDLATWRVQRAVD